MPVCLYCQHESPSGQTTCNNCGMSLPQQTERKEALRLLRFKLFVIGLAVFCAIMIFWLPRSNPLGG